MLVAICASTAHSLSRGSWCGLPPAGSGFLLVADTADQGAHSRWRDGPFLVQSSLAWSCGKREGERREGGGEGEREVREEGVERMMEGDQRICFNVHTSIFK